MVNSALIHDREVPEDVFHLHVHICRRLLLNSEMSSEDVQHAILNEIMSNIHASGSNETCELTKNRSKSGYCLRFTGQTIAERPALCAFTTRRLVVKRKPILIFALTSSGIEYPKTLVLIDVDPSFYTMSISHRYQTIFEAVILTSHQKTQDKHSVSGPPC